MSIDINERFEYWCKKLRILPQWDIKLEIVDDPDWRKTGDFKIDPTDRKAVLMLSANPKQENLEITVEELAKCFLLEFGENKEFSFGRCKTNKSFDELYNGLQKIE